MGAHPLSIQDVIVCGKIDKGIVTRIVDAMASASRAQNCTLTGGETSEQPGVVPEGTYILTASIVGVAEKKLIIDGTNIESGDQVIAVASNGLHTNGYTLVRALLDAKPDLADENVEGDSFIEAVLKPHTCYYHALRDLFSKAQLNGIAHITGGGIRDNLSRILPDSLSAKIDLSTIQIPAIFKVLHQFGKLDNEDMIRTFNMGVGLTLVVNKSSVTQVIEHLESQGHNAYRIGEIIEGEKEIILHDQLKF